jgi:DNA mismatch repair ATPase MutS
MIFFKSGFPFFQLDRFLKILVQDLNKHVAISEEFPRNPAGKVKSGLLFERRVVRIVTPGTLVDEKFMQPFENNYLLSVYAESENLGLAWLDLSTGDFFTQQTSLNSLSSDLLRIGAREILLSRDMDPFITKRIVNIIGEENGIVTWYSTPKRSTFGLDFAEEEIVAGSLLLEFVKDKLLADINVQSPIRRKESENMGIDKNTMRGLEILESSQKTTKGSLLYAIRRTATKSGTRLLRERISSPSTSLALINQRLDLVETLVKNPLLREGIVNLLKRTFDSQRITQKFVLGRGDADDLINLHHTITATDGIFDLIRGLPVLSNSESTLHLANSIANAIDEDALVESHLIDLNSQPETEAREEKDTWIMRRDTNDVLKKLHEELDGLEREKSSLTSHLQETFNVSSLSLRWTPGLGHFCHVKGKDVKKSMDITTQSIGNSKSTRTFYFKEWTTLGNRIDQVKLQIKSEEQRVFQLLRNEVIQNLEPLRRNASILDELDVACSFATIASEQNFTRPILNDGRDFKIIGGQHPTVTLGLEEQGRSFISNDCVMDKKVWLITGPNMAGKSTFLRQNALISILAQVGSFVPAKYAEIGIIDQIFSRIGSADNLYQDQSTFMIEMLETAKILNNATPRSFVIMDEVGRGTTPEDGIAIGYACLNHLYNINKSRTLFATHFHTLADMTDGWSIGYYCTDLKESNDGFTYVHRLREGVNKESHALKVAQLAGMVFMSCP